MNECLISEINDIIKIRKEKLHIMEIENDSIDRQINSENNKIFSTSSFLKISQESLQFVENIANSRRTLIKDQIESILSEAVSIIYGPSYSVALNYDVKNNRSSVVIELLQKTKLGEIRREMDGFGGGVSDVISVPLRLMVLLSAKMNSPICILDECYKHMDLEKIDAVGEFLKDLTEKLGIQLIFCSHHESMKDVANSVWIVSKNNTDHAVVKKYE